MASRRFTTCCDCLSLQQCTSVPRLSPVPCHIMRLSHDDVFRPCSMGEKASHCCSMPLLCSVLPSPPVHPGQLKPTTLPRCRLAPVMCTGRPSLALSSPSRSLPLPHKSRGFFGTLGGIPSPSRLEPSLTRQELCGVPLSLEKRLSASHCSGL